MHGENLFNEIERIHGDIPEGNGVVVFDFSVYFPWRDQDVVSLEFELSTDDEQDMGLKQNPHVLNHRYPNQNYLTLSEKSGRKLGRYGYAIVAPMNVLNKIGFLTVIYSIGNVQFKYVLPLRAHLTEERPCCGLDLRVHEGEDTNYVSLNVHIPCEEYGHGRWKREIYSMCEEHICELKEKFGEKRVFLLTQNEKTGVIEQTIELPACKREQLLVH